MKKRLIATLIAGTVAVSGIIGLSACGKSVSIPKGEEVTKAVWENAFDKTSELTNYTLNGLQKMNITVSGHVSSYDNATSKFKKTEIFVSSKASADMLLLYDEDGQKSYYETSSQSAEKITADGKELNSSSKGVDKSYYELKEQSINDGTEYWCADYSSEEIKSDEKHKIEETFWDAAETSVFEDNYANYVFSDMNFYDGGDEKTAVESDLNELYDKFTYSGGLYTATLYLDASIYQGVKDLIECTVTVSIKDGFAIGIKVKADAEGNAYEKEAYDLNYSYVAEIAYGITKVKLTDASKKVNSEITKALDKAKNDEIKQGK